MRWLLAIVLLLASLPAPAAFAQNDDKAIWLKKDDHSLDVAMAQARATLPIFWKHLAEDRGVQHALVKVGFPTAHRGTEFLWVGLVGFTDVGVRGVIVNEPEDVPNIHAGQTYAAKPSEIVDWAYIKHGKSYGQFTTREMLKIASPEERKAQIETLAATPLEPGDR